MRFLGLLWLVFCDASSWLSPDLDRALGTAALEVTQMSRRFERLRREIASVPRSTLERLLEGLSTSEVDLLKGQGEGKVLEERFVELQSQGASLLKSIRCAQNSSSEASDTFSLLEVSEAEEESGERSETEEAEDAEDEEESDEDEDSEELEDPNEEDDANVLGPEVLEADDEDSCLSAGNVTGYRFTEVSLRRGNFSVLVECFEPFTGVAEVMPCKGHLQEYELRGCSSPTSCSPAKDLQGYVITEASLVFEDFDVSATCEEGYQGKAMVQRCPSPGSPYDLKGCSLLPSPSFSRCGNWTTPEVEDLIQKLQSLAKDLSKHFGRISILSNVSALPSTLGAQRASEALQQLQRAVATAERGKQQQALEVLRRQGAAAARLDPKSLEDEEDFEAISFELEAALVRLDSSVDTSNAPNAAASLGQLNCDLDGLQRANGRFDEAVESFGTILPKMLPREVESLHRVLHSLEVLRHTLQGAPEASECQRYFSGVEQLESDLAHYRSLFNPPAAAAPTPPPSRPRAVPLQPGKLEPLELDLGRGPLPGGSLVGPTALDPRGFR